MIKWSVVKEILLPITDDEDEIISAFANYHCITDVKGDDSHRPGPKVTSQKRRLSFGLVVEHINEYKPVGWTDEDYFTPDNCRVMRERKILLEDIKSGRFVPLESRYEKRKVAYLAVLKPCKVPFVDTRLLTVPLTGAEVVIKDTIQATHCTTVDRVEAIVSGKLVDIPCFGQR